MAEGGPITSRSSNDRETRGPGKSCCRNSNEVNDVETAAEMDAKREASADALVETCYEAPEKRAGGKERSWEASWIFLYAGSLSQKQTIVYIGQNHGSSKRRRSAAVSRYKTAPVILYYLKPLISVVYGARIQKSTIYLSPISIVCYTLQNESQGGLGTSIWTPHQSRRAGAA
jgi:hypothetical protein